MSTERNTRKAFVFGLTLETDDPPNPTEAANYWVVILK